MAHHDTAYAGTPPAWAEPRTLRNVGAASALTAGLLLAVLMMSFQPFISGTASFLERPSGPNTINQIGFSVLGLISVVGMLILADRRRVAAVLDPAWLVIAACLVFSAENALDPASAIRSVMFNIIIIVACLGVVAIPMSATAFRQAAAAAILFVLLLSYFGIFFMPSIAVHLGDSLEPQHAGLWRGVFSHKNVAGPVVAAFLFFGIYFLRSGQRRAGIAIILLSAIFIVQTGSKTTNGMVPAAIAVVFAGRLFGSRILPVVLLLLVFAFAATLTVGTVIHPPLGEAIAPYLEDPSFTGRDTLWAFGLEKIAERPWAGFGFDSFWQQPPVTESLVPFDADWDYRGIVNGHNNFIDTALFMGIPTAAIVIWIICLRPMYLYVRCRPFAENRRLADLCLMILAFVILNSLLESSWFRRADPTWIMAIIALIGMRVASRLRF